ncbi:MAG TPA: CapA family protein [Fimbriimonadaceae bacterium]|nr:CapA family protein [Fimbriimonadaceae bacterium]
MLSLLAVASTGLVSAPSWTLLCGGDVMLNSVGVAKNPFAGIAATVRGSDIAYANLEIPLTNVTTRTPRKTPEQVARKSQFILKADPGHGKWLKATGFDVVSLGNNHTMDYLKGGLEQMLGILDREKIAYAGGGENLNAALAPAVLDTAGLRVGVISYLSFRDKSSNWACWPATANGPGIAVLDFGGRMDAKKAGEVKRAVAKAKRSCDFLVVALHWGVEKTYVPIEYQVALGRAWIDGGADVVVGAHPHRLQGGEVYKGKPILYSMGNLISPLPGDTALIRLKFEGRTFRNAEVIPARISGGRVGLQTGSAKAKGLQFFADLCAKVRAKFPNPRSAALTEQP